MSPNARQKVDLAISAKWIIPIIPRAQILEDCTLLISGSHISGIVPTANIDETIEYNERVMLENHVIMPGLVNSHGHAAMTLLRGFADDKPLMDWLENHIWPAEGKWVNEQFVKDGVELAIAEMLLSGTTCFSDMYFFPEVTAKTAFDTGIRAQVHFPILDFPCAWGTGPDDYFTKGLKLHDNYRAIDRVSIGFGPHAPYTVSDDPIKRVVTLSQELQAPTQIHMHETEFEVAQSQSDHGVRPLQRMADLGLISPLTQLVHMTQINDEDLALLNKHNPHIIHCPHSNLKLASGFCPVDTLLTRGINVALGTDGAASNNGLSLFDEMRTAAMLSKAVSKNASSVDAITALEMATINGAKALGLADNIGSLETGKQADLIAIDLSQLTQQPVYNVQNQLVYSNMQNNVTHVWVDGKQLLCERKLQTINETALRQNVSAWQSKLQQDT